MRRSMGVTRTWDWLRGVSAPKQTFTAPCGQRGDRHRPWLLGGGGGAVQEPPQPPDFRGGRASGLTVVGTGTLALRAPSMDIGKVLSPQWGPMKGWGRGASLRVCGRHRKAPGSGNRRKDLGARPPKGREAIQCAGSWEEGRGSARDRGTGVGGDCPGSRVRAGPGEGRAGRSQGQRRVEPASACCPLAAAAAAPGHEQPLCFPFQLRRGRCRPSIEVVAGWVSSEALLLGSQVAVLALRVPMAFLLWVCV